MKSKVKQQLSLAHFGNKVVHDSKDNNNNDKIGEMNVSDGIEDYISKATHK